MAGWPHCSSPNGGAIVAAGQGVVTCWKPAGGPINYPRHGDQVRDIDAVAFVPCSLTGKTSLRGL